MASFLLAWHVCSSVYLRSAMAGEIVLVLPEKLSHALRVYSEKRSTDPEKLALSFVSRHIPSPVETLTCCHCGKQFPNYKKKKFYCSALCYQSAAFPRLGIGLDSLQDYYGSSISVASNALGVSDVQFRRVVKRFGISNRFEVRNG